MWVGKNGQVKLNNPNYHGNQYNGSKATQIAIAKDIAKKLGIPLTAAFSIARATELPSSIEKIRQSGGSERDVTLEKIDTGMDIGVAVIGLFSKETFVASLVYSGLDYASGGNLSKSVDTTTKMMVEMPGQISRQVGKRIRDEKQSWIDTIWETHTGSDPGW